ncbi:unnamed protein product [Lepidochelys kempii]
MIHVRHLKGKLYTSISARKCLLQSIRLSICKFVPGESSHVAGEDWVNATCNSVFSHCKLQELRFSALRTVCFMLRFIVLEKAKVVASMELQFNRSFFWGLEERESLLECILIKAEDCVSFDK